MTSIRELHVVLSDYCNIKCNYCSVYKKKDVSQYIIDKEALKLAKSVRDKALLEGVHFDIITLIGGEPTTVSPFVLADCVNILQDACNIVSIQTNGVAFGRHQYFNAFKKNIKNKYKLNISISCDGPQSIHDLNRDGSYKYVEKAIDNSINYVGDIGLVCVIGKHTVDNKDIFEQWVKKILSNEAISPQIRVEMGTNRMTDSDQVKLGKIIIDNGLYPYSEVGKKTTLNKGNDCDTLVVSTNTIVRGCLKFTNTEVKLDMTSINENTFDEILEKRKELFSSVLISEDCKTCKYKDICNSGCPLFRKSTGKANECFLRKTVYKEDCNLYGEESGCFKGVGKSISKGVKSVGKGIKKGVKGIGKSIKSGIKFIGNATKSGIKFIGNAIGVFGKSLKIIGKNVLGDFFGLDKLGREVARVGSHIEQIGAVASGRYHDDVKKIQKMQDALEAKQLEYKGQVDVLVEKIDSLIAFPEIFHMAAANRIDELDALYGPQITALIKQLEFAIAQLKKDYDFVIGLTEGAFIQRLIGSIIMIVGGLSSDLGDILSGKANSGTWQRAITVVALVIIVVLMWWNPGGWAAMTALQTAAFVLTVIVTFMTLDGMYANGAATGAIMGMLDFIFNDLLNLDDLIGSDFEKFDKDHEDYQEMVMYTKIALSLTSAGLNWASSAGNYATAAKHGTSAWSEQTAMLAAQDADMAANSATTFFGISTSTYSSIYKAYSAAMSVSDILNAKKAYEAMNDKFAEDKAKLDTLINSKYRKNFMKHYKDTAYFLQDQQEYIDRYVWSMTAESMYVDPYGTTPVANIRFTPDKDTRVMSFGFEDMFDESSSAGSRGYFNSIIYGS